MKSSARVFLLALSALPLLGFRSQEWLGKRMLLDREAERLQEVFAKCSAVTNPPAANVTVPVESYPDGSVKTSVFAKKARFFLADGYFWGEGVTVRQFGAKGAEKSRLDADSCIVDRTTRSGWSQGHAKAHYGDQVELEGDGVYFSAPEEYVRISSNTCVRTDGRVLNARRADYDRTEGVVMLEGDVRLRGTEDRHAYDFRSGKAFAFLEGTNELRRVVALDGAWIASESRTGTCARATYLRRDGKVTMYGAKGGAKAKLVDGGRRRSEIEGARITFWLDAEQVEVVDSEITADARVLRQPRTGGGKKPPAAKPNGGAK